MEPEETHEDNQRNDYAAQLVSVLRRQGHRHARESHHCDHVLAVPGMRKDLDDYQSDTIATPYVGRFSYR